MFIEQPREARKREYYFVDDFLRFQSCWFLFYSLI